MRKPLIALGLAAALGGGLWWLARRPQGNGTLDGQAEAFTLSPLPQGGGLALAFNEGSTPLRAFRWLRPTPDGSLLAQVVTQTDRQHVAVIRDNRLLATLDVPRPESLSEGFFRLAELEMGLVVPGDCAVLLYRNPNAPDSAWIVAMDLPGGALRWHLQLPADRLILGSPGKGTGSLLVQGGDSPIRRLPLALQKGETPGQGRKAPTGVDLPPELPRVVDLLDLGGGTLLAAGPQGLAVHRNGAWTFHPAPPPSPLGFVEPRSRLVWARNRAYWQPEPGRLTELSPEGTPGKMLTDADFGLAGDAQALDASLWQLLGASAEGDLWFGLAAPTLKPASAPVPAPDVPKEAGWTPETPDPKVATPTEPPAPPVDRTALEAHLTKDLARLYRFAPGQGVTRRLDWAEAWPRLALSSVPMPAGNTGVRPEGGVMLVGQGHQAWLLPLSNLPWTEVRPAPVKP